jgi:cytochrome b561
MIMGKTKYDTVAIILHWAIAAAILGLLPVGKWMVGALADHSAPQMVIFQTYQLHKSIGLTVLVLSVIRLGWRLSHPAPPLPPDMSRLERLAATVTHGAFYVLILALPLSGWALVSASPWGLPTIWFGVLEWPHISLLSALEDKKPAEDFFKEMHEILGNAMILLLLLHVAAALKHHFIARDDVLTRMIPMLARGRK